MPYKDKKDQKMYQRKYSGFRAKRNSDMRKAIMNGDLELAKEIMKRKPNIHIK